MSQARIFSDRSRPKRALPAIILLSLAGLAIATWQILLANENSTSPPQNDFIPLPLPQAKQPSALLPETIPQQTDIIRDSNTDVTAAAPALQPAAATKVLPAVIGTLDISEVSAVNIPVASTQKSLPALSTTALEHTPALSPGEHFDSVQYEIQSGDSLSAIFKKNGWPSSDLYAITHTPEGKRLSKIRPGQVLSASVNAGNGHIRSLNWQLSAIS
ncbi:MAG: LysM peptidoglycan-binding domain-containing protein, partial [gamma proteobacterium symbiont of Bathyaustriella thionipta]|nr:LysM peptidoglycan-binding domain-containing protein [gamma proteobacterium symbiont of Bathyaustriella thionipta]